MNKKRRKWKIMENEICFQKSRYAYCKAKQISRKFDPPEFCEYTEQKRESFVEMKEKKFKNGHARSISSDNGDIYDPIQPTNGCIANGRYGNFYFFSLNSFLFFKSLKNLFILNSQEKFFNLAIH